MQVKLQLKACSRDNDPIPAIRLPVRLTNVGRLTGIRNSLIALTKMSRPLPLLAAVLAWILGVSIAIGGGAPPVLPNLTLGFLAVLLVILSIHYANEYADFMTDSMTLATPYSGGSGTLKEGMVSRRFVIHASALTLSIGCGVQLAAVFMDINGWETFAVLIVGAILGLMYSLPPLKLAWRGWGELDNAVLGGIVAPLHAYSVLMGKIDFWVIIICVPFMLLVFNNLLASTWPDREADRKAGKMTLATRWSVSRLRILYWAVTTAAFMLLSILAFTVMLPQVVAISFTALPLSIVGGMNYTKNNISRGAIYAMSLMGVVQAFSWFVVGL